MKLMVAGCSFSAVSSSAPGTSWSEHLAKDLGWELINLARQGCSNGGIRIQIDEIRRQRPDFVFIGPTFWDRMEIPGKSAPYDWNTPTTHWNPPLEQHLRKSTIKNGYDRKDGIDNVNYGVNNYNMICETIFSLAENYQHPYRSGLIDKETQKAIRYYIDRLYDSNWKKQQDEWIITEGLIRLYTEGIRFLVFPELLWTLGDSDQIPWKTSFPNIIPKHYIDDVPGTLLNLTAMHPFTGDDPGYHSNEQGQIEIANKLLEHLRQFHPDLVQ